MVPFLITFMSLFEGRASALFVILAGIGITLMTRSAVASNEQIKFLIAERPYGNDRFSYLF